MLKIGEGLIAILGLGFLLGDVKGPENTGESTGLQTAQGPNLFEPTPSTGIVAAYQEAAAPPIGSPSYVPPSSAKAFNVSDLGGGRQVTLVTSNGTLYAYTQSPHGSSVYYPPKLAGPVSNFVPTTSGLESPATTASGPGPLRGVPQR